MKAPVSWLKEYVSTDCPTEELCHRLTMCGQKVESVEYKCHNLQKIVTGRVQGISKHPDADKLLLIQVDIGQESNIQIVTAATNLSVGDYINAALHGAVLADGKKIKKGSIRGEKSDGMLISIGELGYTENDYPESPEDGIYVYPAPVELGADPAPIMKLTEEIIEFELTSNRPDCLSITGLAREAAAALNTVFTNPDCSVTENHPEHTAHHIKITIDTDNCPRYAARVIKNVKIESSPLWLRHFLTASGIRPINNIVDITNFCMIELGQPLHAFDLNLVTSGHIIVRMANEGEKFTTLDGVERVLSSEMMVISDPHKALALAGVMGGENSMVTESANAILLESANFYGPNIRKTTTKLGLRTDSAARFEKGLDPNLCETAINRAAHLIEKLSCGDVLKGIADCYTAPLKPWTVPFDPSYITNLLGVNIETEQMIKHLESVGITVEDDKAIIPTNRADITIKADIAEEIIRLYGYDKIDETLAPASTLGKKTRAQIIEKLVKDVLIHSSFCEMLSFTFESQNVMDKLLLEQGSEEYERIRIINPLGEDFRMMRRSPLNALLTSLSTNYNRRNKEAALFEIGKIYIPGNPMPVEKQMLILGMYGCGDFFTLKGVLESVFLKLGVTAVFEKCVGVPFLHPGRSALISIGKNAGYIGALHPTVLENYELSEAFVAVIDFNALIENAELIKPYKPLPKYPGIKRDIALIAESSVTAADIEAALRERGGKNLTEITLFDVYTGDQVQKGYKSMAYSLFFRSHERTLTEDEVNVVIEKILKNAEERVGAKLRL